MTEKLAPHDSQNAIKKVFDSFGYESGQDYELLPQTFDLVEIDIALLTIIPDLLKKIASKEDHKEVGYISKICGKEIVLSELTTGSDDGEHIHFDVNDFLTLYRIDGERKREKLLYDIHTHEVADIGPSPKDLTNLFKEIAFLGGHFSIIVTATKVYLLVRTKQTPSMKVLDAIKHVNTIQEEFKSRFTEAISSEKNFIATRMNKIKLLSEVNSAWLPVVCKENSIGLYELDISDLQQEQKLQLKKI